MKATEVATKNHETIRFSIAVRYAGADEKGLPLWYIFKNGKKVKANTLTKEERAFVTYSIRTLRKEFEI